MSADIDGCEASEPHRGQTVVRVRCRGSALARILRRSREKGPASTQADELS